MGTDRIDLYQIHFPDNNTPLEETIEALDGLVRAGKVREIGCSNFSTEQIEESERISADKGLARFVSVQNEYSLLRRLPEQNGVLDACARRRRRDSSRTSRSRAACSPASTGATRNRRRAPGSPGMPADRREQAFADKNFDRVEALDAWAREHGPHAARTRIRMAAARPPVASVIAGATKPEQVARQRGRGGLAAEPADLDAIDAVIEQREGLTPTSVAPTVATASETDGRGDDRRGLTRRQHAGVESDRRATAAGTPRPRGRE